MLEKMADAEGIASVTSLVERSIRMMYSEHPLVVRKLRRS